MDEAAEAYRRLLNRRQVRWLRRLGEGPLREGARSVEASPVARVVRRAARELHRRERAEQAWARVADPAWRGQTRVDRVEGRTLVVLADSPTLAYELQRRAGELLRQLSGLLSGVDALRFVCGGHGD